MDQNCWEDLRLRNDDKDTGRIRFRHASQPTYIPSSEDYMCPLYLTVPDNIAFHFTHFKIMNPRLAPACYAYVRVIGGQNIENIDGLDYSLCDNSAVILYRNYTAPQGTLYIRVYVRNGVPVEKDRYGRYLYYSDVSFDMTYFKFKYGPCSDTDHRCKNGRCIAKSLMCKGGNPCGDNSDCVSNNSDNKGYSDGSNMFEIAIVPVSGGLAGIAVLVVPVLCILCCEKCERRARRRRQRRLDDFDFELDQFIRTLPPDALTRMNLNRESTQTLQDVDGVANTESTLVGLANTESTSNGVANTESTSNGAANTESTSNGVANTESTFNGVANTESTFNGVANTESTFNGVANTESTLVGLANTESTFNGVANTESTFNGVANTESTFNGVANTESTFNGVANKESIFDGIANTESTQAAETERTDNEEPDDIQSGLSPASPVSVPTGVPHYTPVFPNPNQQPAVHVNPPSYEDALTNAMYQVKHNMV